MFCDQCGKENPDNAQFCRSCGNKFGTLPDQGAAPKAADVKMSLLGMIVVGVGVLLIIGLVLSAIFYPAGITVVLVIAMALLVLARPGTWSGLVAVGIGMLFFALVFAISDPGVNPAVKLGMEKIVCAPGYKLIIGRDVTSPYQGKSVLTFPKKCQAPDGSFTKVGGGMSYLARLIFYLAVGAGFMVITAFITIVKRTGAGPGPDPNINVGP